MKETSESLLKTTQENSSVRVAQRVSGQGGNLARRRYQLGSLSLRGKRTKVWVLRWREDIVGSDGETRRVRKETILGDLSDIPTQKLARRRADILLARVNRPDYRPGKVIGFEEFCARWEEHVLSQQKPSSQAACRSHLRFHLQKHFGRMRLDQIGQEEIQGFVAATGKALARHTIMNVLGTLFAILKSAHQWGYVVNEIRQADLTIPNHKPAREGRSFSAEQVIAILEGSVQPWRTVFYVAAMTGMRPGEVLALTVDDLDFDGKQIFVRRSAWYSQIVTPKSPKSVAPVPMPAPLERALREYLITWKPNAKGFLFANTHGNPHSHAVRLGLWPVLDALKIPRCGMHAFRHAHGSLLISTGASAKVAQEQLRHADPMTTLRNYTHIIGDERRKAVDKIASMFEAPRYIQ